MGLKCKMCGSDLYPEEGQRTIVCDFCGATQTIPIADESNKINLFDEANNLRRQNRFDEAKKMYKSIIEQYPEEYEAYWCLVLCEFGIEYIDDPKKEKKIPTCHRTLTQSIFDNEYYRLSIEKASDEEKQIYQEEAKEIDRIQKNILEMSRKNGAEYDIFICFKESDENKKRTADSAYATKIYEKLTENGYRVFFSRITLKSVAGSNYEPYIFQALQSSKVLIAVGTKPEYMESPWVRNEWSRYLSFIEEDPDKAILPCIADMDPYEMPEDLQSFQCLNMKEIDFDYNLVSSLNHKFGRSSNSQANNKNNQPTEEDKEKLAKRVKLKIIDGNYDEANEILAGLLEDDFENKNLWELKIQILCRGETKKNDPASKALKALLSFCSSDDEKRKYKEKYSFLLRDDQVNIAQNVEAQGRMIGGVSSQTPITETREVINETIRDSSKSNDPVYNSDSRIKIENEPQVHSSFEGFNNHRRPEQPQVHSSFEGFNNSRTQEEPVFHSSFEGFNNANAIRSSNLAPNADSIYEKGERHYEKGEYFNALDLFKKASNMGSVLADIRIADCYFYGNGVPLNYDEAFIRYLKAANKGIADAQNKVAICYEKGLGTIRNDILAFEFFLKSANNGNNLAQRNVAECYRLGKGTNHDDKQAIYWLEQSAKNGNSDSQNSLGYCYEKGNLVKKDLEKAFTWYTKAAEQGNQEAQCNLGMLYYFGKCGTGVQDCEKAAYWYKKAAEKGHAISQYNLSALYKTGRLNGSRDIQHAFDWLKKSAEQGYVVAQFKLAVAYEKGEGTPVNIDSAYYWYKKAERQNYPNADKAARRLNV